MTVDREALGRALRSLVDLAGPPGTTTPALVERIEQMVAGAATVLHVDGAALLLLGDDDRPRLAAGSDEVVARAVRAQVEHGQGPGIDALRSGNAAPVDDLAEHPGWPDLRADLAAPPASPVRAVLSAPVLVEGEVAGVLDTVHHQPHGWTLAEVRATAAYADVIGLALRVTAHADELGLHRRRLRDELDLGRARGTTP